MACAIAITGERGFEAAAERLARDYGIAYAAGDLSTYDAVLAVCKGRTELRWLDDSTGFTPIAIDLTAIDASSPQGRSLRQPIARAVGLRKGDPTRPHVLDATAGFGQDAWLLASLGCRVTAVERAPAMAILLADALRRAASAQPKITARIKLVRADAGRHLEVHRQKTQQDRIDVVYLDPMFPPKRKAAKPRKQMVLLSQIVGPDRDSDTLFATAMAYPVKRVVVKRPLHAPPITPTPDPVAVHAGKSHRFDVYRPSE